VHRTRSGKNLYNFSEDRLRKELRLFTRDKKPEGLYVFVLDPTFNADNKRAIRLLDMIETETKGSNAIHWHFEGRAELLTREQARRFARIKASLQIGLQSAEPKVAAKAGRPFDKRRFASRIALLNEEGVIFGLDLIYGLPGDTLAGYLRSMNFAFSLYPNNLDMFRLSVLPGTMFFEKAAEYGIEAEPEAPYEVKATPQFPAADLAKAEHISRAADIFYNKGRAVAWFNQALRPLRVRPAKFFERFADEKEKFNHEQDESLRIEAMQLGYLKKCYQQAGKAALLPALEDIVRFNGAWGRALVEGTETKLEFHYEPNGVLSEEALDLEYFVTTAKPHKVQAVLRPSGAEPELSIEQL
jgi:radical SAM superfamily enzyme YgiQ (UPF0313 family)